jgi:hypothetical protein
MGVVVMAFKQSEFQHKNWLFNLIKDIPFEISALFQLI